MYLEGYYGKTVEQVVPYVVVATEWIIEDEEPL